MGFLVCVLVLPHGKLRVHGLRLRPDLCSALGPSPSPSPSGELSCDCGSLNAGRGAPEGQIESLKICEKTKTLKSFERLQMRCWPFLRILNARGARKKKNVWKFVKR